MARTLKTYRLNLNESFQKRIMEIGQRVSPTQTDFLFREDNLQYVSEFNYNKHHIIVYFYVIDKNKKMYEIDFGVDGTSFGDNKTVSLKEFFTIISTVIECINNFIKKYNPKKLYIEAADKQGKFGQKQKIWREYVLQNIKDTGFVIGTGYENGKIILQRSNDEH